MKPMKKLITLALLVMMVATAAISFAEATGSAAVVGSQTYTLEQMLTYAIQDEYAARATYVAIQKAFGEQRPFANIDGAESTHVAELTVLFNTYGLTVPADTATAAAPATVAEAYAASIAIETTNIAMYAKFLAQSDLPADVRATFVALQNASTNHLAAFTRSNDRAGLGGRYGANDNTRGRGQGMMGQGVGQANNGTYCDPDDCPLGANCLRTDDTNNWGRGGRNW